MTNQLNDLIGSLCNEIKELRNEVKAFRGILEQPNEEVEQSEQKISTLHDSNHLSIDKQISDILINLQVSVSIKGFRFLKEAIKMYLYDHGTSQITKVVYPELARKFKDTPSRVERAIRHAIQTSWHKSITSGSPYLKGCLIDKPTNSEFIALVAEKISLDKQEESA